MLKGINKQIIEIRCTNDEYFEKALLFVRAGKEDDPRPQLLGQAAATAGELTARSTRKKHSIRLPLMLTAAAVLTVAAVCVIVFS